MRKKANPLVKAKNAVRGSFNTPKSTYFEQIQRYGAPRRSSSDILMQGLQSLKSEDSDEFLSWLSGFPSSSISLFPNKPIRKPSNIAFGNIATKIPLFARVHLLTLLMLGVGEKLAHFFELKEHLEAALISEHYDDAISRLDEIEEHYGYSLWGIELRIALLQSWKGLEAQKEYVSGVKGASPSKAAAVVAFWASQRNEEGTIYARFLVRIRAAMARWKIPDVVKSAYAYVLGVDSLGAMDDLTASSVLASVASVSMIDAYGALKDAIATLIERGELLPPDLVQMLTHIAPPNDTFAIRLAALATGELGTMTLGLSENPDAALSKPSDLETIRSEQIDVLMDSAYASAVAGVRRDQPARRLLREELDRLAALSIGRTPGFAQGVDVGLKRLANFKGTDFARAFDGFIRLHDASAPVFQLSAATALFLYSRRLHPWHAAVVPEPLSRQIVDAFPDSQLASTIKRSLSTESSETSTLARELSARRALDQRDAAAALLSLGDIAENSFEDRRLTPLRVRALLLNGNLDAALRAAADLCVRDAELVSKLPLEPLVEELRAVKFNTSDKLSQAIILHAYLLNKEDSQIFQQLQFAFEDWLSQIGVDRPSSIDPAIYLSDPRAIFLMREIAVPAVLDVSFWLYKTSRDTMLERLAVCSVLTTADGIRVDQYQDEIKQITRVIDIEDGLEDVDRSRVFVDRKRLERWANQEIRESFERYKALTSVGIGFDDPAEFDKTIKDFLAGKDISATNAAQFPRDEAGQLLIEMFDLVVDKYFNDEDFGLDAYLSMRVRHGSLAGHLRGALEETGLLVARDKATGKFPVAPEWADLSDEVVAFSTAYDVAVSELTKEKLQIKGKEHQSGLFHFEMQPLNIYYVRSGIDESSTLEEFLAKIYDILDVYLARSLQQVRNFITGDFRERIEVALAALSQAPGLSQVSPRRSELQNTIAAASPDWQASIDRVASWFAPSEDNEKAALRTIQQIVEIAIQATRNAHRGFDPVLELDIDEFGPQSADVLVVFTDLLFTILDNVHRHCCLDEQPRVTISVKQTSIEPPNLVRVLLTVCNNVGENAKSHASLKRIGKIRSQIDAGDYKSRVKNEGGTGFLKLKRIIAADPRQTLEFDFHDDGFCVSVGLVVVYYLASEGRPS